MWVGVAQLTTPHVSADMLPVSRLLTTVDENTGSERPQDTTEIIAPEW